ncbi:hypothetical protein L3X38_022101 [Prunus dulcis]|uniref:Uncharacterized protein n=1 Tax=Prunus dulcis TaxID=3755 RepID=A0AAD4Z496_PRUDU|nr:hypothetical protein L3X38_021661 [Prunus dulcis]KAI5331974.1 hypothetical protein L3X38_022101 [Prunus dulcis]
MKRTAAITISSFPLPLPLKKAVTVRLSLPKNGLHCEACCGCESYGSDWISWAVREGDILTLLESEREARRLR